MTFTQTVEIPASRRLIIDVPHEMPEGPAILSFVPTAFKKDSAFGCFHHFANPAQIHDEKDAWTQAVLEKHAKN